HRSGVSGRIVSFVPPFGFIMRAPPTETRSLAYSADARDPITAIISSSSQDEMLSWLANMVYTTRSVDDQIMGRRTEIVGWPTNQGLRSIHSWRRGNEVPTAAAADDTGGELRATRLANRPRELAQAFPAARARQGAVARGAGVARAGTG